MVTTIEQESLTVRMKIPDFVPGLLDETELN